ncbi:hypothetical protein [Micavibrio aeruginosavorus]|uniref:hypothetical protein n=1 Tax=Micavibrio aeruginosavorus TaxID=349221 RepID=UPI003F4AAA6E
MKPVSLNHTMIQMSQRLDAYLDARDAEIRQEESGQDEASHNEERALRAVDSLLAHLHKQALDAEIHFKRLEQQRGAKDPMAQIAADMMDSAKSAYLTRMLEAREDDAVQAAVKAMLLRLDDEREAELAETKQKFWDRLNAFHLRMRRQMEAEQNTHDPFMAFMAMMMMNGMSAGLNNSIDAAQKQMRRQRTFAAAFAEASFGPQPGGSMSAFAGS